MLTKRVFIQRKSLKYKHKRMFWSGVITVNQAGSGQGASGPVLCSGLNQD